LKNDTKKIHYCWFGKNIIPETLQKCIATWKEFLPDYEFILWNEEKFDVNSVEFVKEAYSIKKYAFATDYIRLYALYTQGGIYFDTDVVLKQGLDDYLNYVLKADKNSAAIHIGYGSWRKKNFLITKLKQIPFINIIIKNNFIRKLCGKKKNI